MKQIQSKKNNIFLPGVEESQYMVLILVENVDERKETNLTSISEI